jgi:hypothetical protein
MQWYQRRLKENIHRQEAYVYPDKLYFRVCKRLISIIPGQKNTFTREEIENYIKNNLLLRLL